MSKGKLVVISGASGVGKGTVLGIMMQKREDLFFSVSATTRKPREGEVDGVNYYYKTREEFENLIRNGEVLEHTEYNGNYYGTLKSEAERITGSGRDLLLEIEVDGGGQVKRLMGDRCVTVMLVAPDAAELERRLRGRGTETDDVIKGRLMRAREELLEAPNYDYVVVNENGKSRECAEEIMAIMKAEHSRIFRNAEFLEKYFA